MTLGYGLGQRSHVISLWLSISEKYIEATTPLSRKC